MRVSVEFEGERLELDMPEERLVSDWHGPAGVASAEVVGLVVHALEEPRDFPPLRRAVVAGDRVLIALGADVPEASLVLAAVCGLLESAGVELSSITVLADPDSPAGAFPTLPKGVSYEVHDPDDRRGLAYLAATTDERRVYLNHLLTDADLVLPIGRLAHDPALGHRGPWGVIFPGMSDSETRQAYRVVAGRNAPDREKPEALQKESVEVSWLLGCQFHIGLVAGVTGLVEVVAGLGSTVLDQGIRAIDRIWGVKTESRAELVVVGIGRPGVRSEIGDVARGLATATRLVQRGGKIVVLSRAVGEIGPAMSRLIAIDNPRAGPAALRGHEGEIDFVSASQLAQALAWADVYLLSSIGTDVVEDLSMIALDRPEEARRLVATSGSCMVVSQAEHSRPILADETD